MQEITQDLLLEFFEYKEGNLYWRERSEKWFRPSRSMPAKDVCREWNKKFAGNIAGAKMAVGGYRQVTIFNRHYLAHRLIWMMHFGQWPRYTIDHINGDGSDSRIENLRDVSHKDNGRNQKAPKTNKSGQAGVTWYKPSGKWRARIMVDHKEVALGYFEDFEAAAAARKSAERFYGFHENHGRLQG